MEGTRQPLRIASTVELATLVVMLANLFTVHLPAISSPAGPTHGCAYLFSFVAVLRDPQRTSRAIALSLLPGIGGLLALRQLAPLKPTKTDDPSESVGT